MPPGSESEDNYHQACHEFFSFDEHEINETKGESVVALIQTTIVSGILNGSPAELELNDTVANCEEAEEAIEVPMITSDTAIHYMCELTCFLQILKASEIPTPTGKRLHTLDFEKQSVHTLAFEKQSVQRRVALLG